MAIAAGALVSCERGSAPAAPKPVPSVAAPKPRPGRVASIDLNTLLFLQQNDRALIYDARASVIHAYSHLPGAISWPRSAFHDQLATREAEIRAAAAAGKTIVVYCTDTGCPDARAVARQLAARGHTVSVLDGGFHAWKDAGLPVE
jgi:rhodanese-related sulfurtransferase